MLHDGLGVSSPMDSNRGRGGEVCREIQDGLGGGLQRRWKQANNYSSFSRAEPEEHNKQTSGGAIKAGGPAAIGSH